MQEFANRSAFFITPKEPFKEWAKKYNNESTEELDARLNEKHIYLVEFATEEDLRDILSPYYVEIFEYELMSWNHLKHEWPEDRSIDVFLDWFEATLCDDIFDLESEAIETEKV
jgi:hypothetical protein